MTWVEAAASLVWSNVWVVIPLALAATLACRLFPCRPVTRHGVWLVVLLCFLITLILPAPPAIPAVGAWLGTPDPIVAGVDTSADQPRPRSAARENRPSNGDAGVAQVAPRPSRRAHSVRDRDVRREVAQDRRPARTTPIAARPSAKRQTSPPPKRVRLATESPARATPRDLGPVATPTPRVKPSRAAEPIEPLISHYATGRDSAPAVSPNAVDPSAGEQPVAPWRAWLGAAVLLRGTLLGLPAMPAWFWLGGVSVLACLAVLRTWWFQRGLGRGWRAPKWAVRETALIARRLNLRQVPRITMVDRRVSPMIWCGWTPRLILPIRLWTQLDRAGRRAILCHELAHLRRRDHWIRWLELAVSLLWWWHPIAWWVRRRLHDEADMCCDAWVTWLMPRGRRAYAEALLTTKQYVDVDHPRVPVLGAVVRSSGARRLARRVTMVMTRNTRPGQSFMGAGLAMMLVLAAWVVTPALSCPPKEETEPSPPTTEKREHVVRQQIGEARTQTVSECEKVTHAHAAAAAEPPKAGKPPKAPRAPNAAVGRALPRLPAIARGGGYAAARDDYEHAAPTAWTDVGALVVRKYELPEGKLETLTKLMVRPDVPIRVRPLDGALEVHATAAQHHVFTAFVNMIQGKEEWKEYRLPEGKLEALSELMVRNDVPIMVRPGDDDISVQGTALEQGVFEAFVNLIHPRGRGVAGGPPVPLLEEIILGVPPGAPAPALAEMVDRHARGVLEHNEARREALMAQAERIASQAEEIEQQAEELEAQAEELREEAVEVEGEPARRRAIERQARALERKARRLEQRARQLESSAEEYELKAEEADEGLDELNVKVDELNEALEALGEHGAFDSDLPTLLVPSSQPATARFIQSFPPPSARPAMHAAPRYAVPMPAMPAALYGAPGAAERARAVALTSAAEALQQAARALREDAGPEARAAFAEAAEVLRGEWRVQVKAALGEAEGVLSEDMAPFTVEIIEQVARHVEEVASGAVAASISRAAEVLETQADQLRQQPAPPAPTDRE